VEFPSAVTGGLAVYEEFLSPSEMWAAIGYALSNEARFAASGVVGANERQLTDPDHRRSRVLYELGPLQGLMEHRLLSSLPRILYRLSMPAFAVNKIELQLTATGDGEFFRPHVDNSHSPVSSRRITFVCYIGREPAPFTGGALRFDDEGQASEVSPSPNSIVFFPSGRRHEVAQVSSPSGLFADSRFTLNGWLHA
jgi:Rps23 Pro-64 3,4-dihydroxylase Tpa1-like proline 4-hydroxylase